MKILIELELRGLGRKLRLARIRTKQPVRMLAKQAGVSRNQWNKWENEVAGVPYWRIPVIEQIVGIELVPAELKATIDQLPKANPRRKI